MILYNFGRWIYFDKATGEILHDTQEVKHTDPDYETKRDPFTSITKLMDRDPNSVGIIKLEPGAYAQDFAEGFLGSVNPDTLELEFAYLDQSNPETPPVLTPPLTQQVAELKSETAALNLAIIDVWETLAAGGGA